MMYTKTLMSHFQILVSILQLATYVNSHVNFSWVTLNYHPAKQIKLCIMGEIVCIASVLMKIKTKKKYSFTPLVIVATFQMLMQHSLATLGYCIGQHSSQIMKNILCFLDSPPPPHTHTNLGLFSFLSITAKARCYYFFLALAFEMFFSWSRLECA